MAEQVFLYAHDRRHQLYASLLNLPKGTLEGPVDSDWMLRHAARHATLATVLGDNLSSGDTKVLAPPGRWKTQRELDDWVALHDRLHMRIDSQLNT